MIILGGREDVIAQWISKDFIMRYSGFFKEMVIGPGEYAVVIKNGRIVDVVTQKKLEGLSGGFLQILKNWLGGGEDLQVLIVDVRPKRVEVGFQGYTKDRVEVAGKANLLLRISPKDAVNVIKLMYGPTKLKIPPRLFYTKEKGAKKVLKHIRKGRTDKAGKELTDLRAQEMMLPGYYEEGEISTDKMMVEWEYAGAEGTPWVKELTVLDLQQKLQEEFNAAIQTNVLIMHDSTEFHENMRAILDESIKVVESLKPLWSSFGIEVLTATFSFDKNQYEDLQRRIKKYELDRKMEDLEFLKQIGEKKRAAEVEKEEKKIEYDKWLFDNYMNFDKMRVDKGVQYELDKIDEEYKFGIDDLKKKFEQELGFNVERRKFDFETEMAVKKQTVSHEMEGKEIQFEHEKEKGELEHRIGLEERAIEHEGKVKDYERTQAMKDAEAENAVRNIGVIGETERQKIVARAEVYRRQLEASIGHYEEMKKLDIEKHRLELERQKLEMGQDMEDREAMRDMAVMEKMAKIKKELREMDMKEKQIDREYDVRKVALQADVEKTKALADAEARKAAAQAQAEKLKADEIISKYEQAVEGQRKHELEKEKLEIEKVKAMSGLVKEPQVVNVQPGTGVQGGGKATKVCPHCGRVIPASALYCPYCGKKVE